MITVKSPAFAPPPQRLNIDRCIKAWKLKASKRDSDNVEIRPAQDWSK